jgi:hypothetical protein
MPRATKTLNLVVVVVVVVVVENEAVGNRPLPTLFGRAFPHAFTPTPLACAA